MNVKALPATVALGAAVMLTPALSVAQGSNPPGPPQAQPELVFEREAFIYPQYQRRNPFRPLLTTEAGGPRWDQLRLVGIIFSNELQGSVAILGTSAVNVSEDGGTITLEPGRSWYLKVGERLGNITVVGIQERQVIVEFEEFGLIERRSLQLQTLRFGGGP